MLKQQTADAITQIGRLVRDYDHGDPDGPLFVELLEFAGPLGDAQRAAVARIVGHLVETIETEADAREERQLRRVLAHLPVDLADVYARLYKHAYECREDGCTGWWKANAAYTVARPVQQSG